MSIEHRMSRVHPGAIDDSRGTPRLTIVIEGENDIHRFAYNLLHDQVEFAEVGRQVLKSQRRRFGPQRWRAMWHSLHGEHSKPLTFHWGRDL